MLKAISQKPLGIVLNDFTFDLMTYKGNFWASMKKIHETDFHTLVFFTWTGS